MPRNGNNSDEFITIECKRYLLTYHVKRRMEIRNVDLSAILTVLTNWVAKKFNVKNNSMNYYGFVHGHNYLIMVRYPKLTGRYQQSFPMVTRPNHICKEITITSIK